MIKKIITLIALMFFIMNIKAQTKSKGDDDDDDKDTVPVRHVNRVVSNKIDTEFDKNKDKGAGPYKEFYANGKLSYEGTYKNYKEIGLWKRYNEIDGISSKDYHNSNGDIDSTFRYNETGKIAGEMRWKNGLKNGIWREYSSDGVLQKLETYKENQLNGKSLSYDKGKIYIESNYISNTLDGPWKEYHDNGKPRKTGSYKAGEKDGEWKEYDDEGTLTNTEKYVNGETKD